MPKEAKTHSDWLLLICGVCCKKPKKDLRNITQDILKIIRANHYKEYSLTWMPSKVCKTCLNTVRDVDNNKENSRRKLPNVDYDNMKKPVPLTRGNPRCHCTFCEIGHLNGREYTNYLSHLSKSGNPVEFLSGIGNDSDDLSSNPAADDIPRKETVQICQRCKGKFGIGIHHKCNKRSYQDNLFEMVRESSPGTKQIVAARLIDSICEDKNVDKSSGTLALKTRGSKKVINIGKQKPKRQFSVEDLHRFSDRNGILQQHK